MNRQANLLYLQNLRDLEVAREKLKKKITPIICPKMSPQSEQQRIMLFFVSKPPLRKSCLLTPEKSLKSLYFYKKADCSLLFPAVCFYLHYLSQEYVF